MTRTSRPCCTVVLAGLVMAAAPGCASSSVVLNGEGLGLDSAQTFSTDDNRVGVYLVASRTDFGSYFADRTVHVEVTLTSDPNPGVYPIGSGARGVVAVDPLLFGLVSSYGFDWREATSGRITVTRWDPVAMELGGEFDIKTEEDEVTGKFAAGPEPVGGAPGLE